MCIFISKFLSLMLWLVEVCTDADNTGTDDTKTDNDDNYGPWTNHDYIGSFGMKRQKHNFKCKASVCVSVRYQDLIWE